MEKLQVGEEVIKIQGSRKNQVGKIVNANQVYAKVDYGKEEAIEYCCNLRRTK
jgi:hypothetical protein